MPDPAPAFRLDYGDVRDGWIDVSARLGDVEVKETASYLGEPVAAWIVACIELRHHQENEGATPGAIESRAIDWEHEPANHRFTLSLACGSSDVTLSHTWDPDPRWRDPNFRPARIHPPIVLSWRSLATEVCRASRELYRRYGLRRYIEGWTLGAEFPAGRLLQLHGLVHGRRIFDHFASEHELLLAEAIPEPMFSLPDFVPEGMHHADFHIGREFLTATGRWICTDKGTRTIIAARLPLSIEIRSGHIPPLPGAFKQVFDEHDLEGCSPMPR